MNISRLSAFPNFAKAFFEVFLCVIEHRIYLNNRRGLGRSRDRQNQDLGVDALRETDCHIHSSF
jgi:hypothetical protein